LNPKELNQCHQKKKVIFHNYINDIKKNAKWNLNTIINPTLVKNSYASSFPKNYFSNKIKNKNITVLFINNIIKFYFKNIYFLFSYFIAFILYKLHFKKQRKYNLETIIDVFGLVDQTNQNDKFSENYLTGLYDVFEKFNKQFTILLRPYPVEKNPFKLKQFFKIINKDKRDFVFEYEFLRLFDFLRLLVMILKYPFQVLSLNQNVKSNIDKIFNVSLIEDIKYFNFTSLTRYILGENLSKIDSIKKIYSWSEFQVIERSFNHAIRKNCDHIELIGLQFYPNFETYFNTADDVDYDMLSFPHKMLVNGKYYIMDRGKIKYEIGVSLRYKDIFNFKGIEKEKNILLLGSYIESDTKYMLDSVKKFDHVIFKNHPAVNIKRLGKLPENISVSNENIYELFKNTKLVIGTASTASVESVCCGISVIIMASQENLTANPLLEKGQGNIWDIAFNVNELDKILQKLIDYRVNNKAKIIEIADWYKDNLFVEPTEKNIINVFDLEKEK
tara:strand:+ start:187 stop:1692 length:1506 start_codon:yes stop_codon:yes gene_type:complete